MVLGSEQACVQQFKMDNGATPLHMVCKVSSKGTFCWAFNHFGVLEVYPSDNTALEVVNLGKDPSVDKLLGILATSDSNGTADNQGDLSIDAERHGYKHG